MLTKEQQEARRKGIGGSDASAICGLDKYRSPVDIYLEKIGESNAEDISHKSCIRRGNFLEQFAAQLYAEEKGVRVRKCNKMLAHPKYQWMLANIDRVVVGSKIILECKTANVFLKKEWGEESSDTIPDGYLMQAAHYAAVCGVAQVDIAVYFTDDDFRIYTYRRNKKLEESLIEIERNFWENHVLKRVPPHVASMDDAKKLYPVTDDSAVLASNDLLEQINAYKELQQQAKELNNKIQQIKTSICGEMGLASTLQDELGNKLVTWNLRESNRLDTDRLKKDHPELYKQYCKKSAERYFTVK